jgi:hypothetical protein
MGSFLALFPSVFHAGLAKLGFVLQFLLFSRSSASVVGWTHPPPNAFALNSASSERSPFVATALVRLGRGSVAVPTEYFHDQPSTVDTRCASPSVMLSEAKHLCRFLPLPHPVIPTHIHITNYITFRYLVNSKIDGASYVRNGRLLP